MSLQDGIFSDSWIKKMRGSISIDFGDTTPGLFKGALYTGAVAGGTIDFDQTDPAYTSSPFTSNEAAGPGYTAGGLDLTITGLAVLVGTANKVGWGLNSLLWLGTTITADGILLYIPSLSSRAWAFRYFGQPYPTSDGDFEIGWPPDGAWREKLRATA
ncbi:hypothetical protein ACFQ08_03190 [Streptosporangium algeriense]|uniref:Uncharacterized protein n=1 Tax=Streptosporangium algeriense TaxID=1682748 RepID=A0ABW3DL67_9ACTN